MTTIPSWDDAGDLPGGGVDDDRVLAVIGRVAELHGPSKVAWSRFPGCSTCHCDWPCPTANIIGDAWPWPEVE